MSIVDFAILAPVPLEHLESGLTVAKETGYVSFGSMKWDLFRKVDDLRYGVKVPTLIYPSHEGVAAKLTFKVGWAGWYIGHVQESSEMLLDEESHRPPTTVKYQSTGDSATGWAIFWRLEGLQQLPENQHVEIRQLASYKTGFWRKNFPPYGPEIIARPSWI